MKPWQTLLFAALILNGLTAAAFFFAGLSNEIKSLAAGAFLPVVVSASLLFLAEALNLRASESLQKLNLIGFFIKILVVGIWVSVLILSGAVSKVTFVISLTINFLVWHGVEAYYWPLFWSGRGQPKGE